MYLHNFFLNWRSLVVAYFNSTAPPRAKNDPKTSKNSIKQMMWPSKVYGRHHSMYCCGLTAKLLQNFSKNVLKTAQSSLFKQQQRTLLQQVDGQAPTSYSICVLQLRILENLSSWLQLIDLSKLGTNHFTFLSENLNQSAGNIH